MDDTIGNLLTQHEFRPPGECEQRDGDHRRDPQRPLHAAAGDRRGTQGARLARPLLLTSHHDEPKPSARTVPATKYGRSGSNVAASPAPLRPSATATRGPAQQSVETTAATTPPVAASAALVTDVVMIFQNLQDRAVIRRPSGRARRGQPL